MLILAVTEGQAEHAEPGHPERPDRAEAALAGVADLGLGSDLVLLESAPASLEQLAMVHSLPHLEALAALSHAGGGALDPDTYVSPGSWEVACRAAGAGLAAVEALDRAGEGVALVVTRPPGHHASRHESMGFCLVNNIAVAAASLVADGQRVAIVDWDVHHGNGTQAVFWDEPDVLFISTHQAPLFPGTGGADEVGGLEGLGTTLNVPVPPGATGDVLQRAWEEVAAPVVESFRPDWVLVSAGYDAHLADPLAQLALSSGDFAALARMVAEVAPRPGRVGLFLEGGYHLGALRSSVAATLGALLGADATGQARWYEKPTSGGPGTTAVVQAAELRKRALAGAAPA